MIDAAGDFVSWWTTDRLSVTGALAALGVAAYAARTGVKQLRAAALDSAARSRPVVTAELRENPAEFDHLDLVIVNHGPSAARNLRVTFEPDLPDIDECTTEGHFFVTTTRTRYRRIIPTLGPGQRLVNLYYVPDRSRQGTPPPNREPVPETIAVTVEYGSDVRTHEPGDTFFLDVRAVLAGSHVESAASVTQKEQEKENTAALKRISESLALLAGPIARRRDAHQRAFLERADRAEEERQQQQQGSATAGTTGKCNHSRWRGYRHWFPRRKSASPPACSRPHP